MGGEQRKFELTGPQIVGSTLAAVTAAVAASYLGVTGTVIGAALVSAATTVGSAVYTHYLRRTGEKVKRHTVARRARARRGGRGGRRAVHAPRRDRTRGRTGGESPRRRLPWAKVAAAASARVRRQHGQHPGLPEPGWRDRGRPDHRHTPEEDRARQATGSAGQARRARPPGATAAIGHGFVHGPEPANLLEPHPDAAAHADPGRRTRLNAYGGDHARACLLALSRAEPEPSRGERRHLTARGGAAPPQGPPAPARRDRRRDGFGRNPPLTQPYRASYEPLPGLDPPLTSALSLRASYGPRR